VLLKCGGTSPLIAALLAHQNADGGFGDKPGHSSTAYDTAYALEALAIARYSDTAVLGVAVNYLLQLQQADGGFTDNSNNGTVYLAALAMRALWYVRHSYVGVPASLTRAQSFLLAQRDATGLWGENFVSATALIALIQNLPDPTPVSSSLSALRASQGADGSWDADPFTTALALRALQLADAPQPNPDYVTITGRVIDSQTAIPLGGVAVSLTGPASLLLTTGSDGSFVFRSLPAGSYTAQLTLANYGTLTTITSGQIGQTLDLGTLALTKSQGATTGTIQGVVRDSATSQPLAGVSVSATGVATPVLTDGSGAYQISNVPAGLVTVGASLAGYSTASGSANLAAGGLMVFSPILAAGNSQGTSLGGTVRNGATGAPLAGVVVSVAGVSIGSATTDSAGNYQISGLIPGVVTITASLAGFDTVTAGSTLPQNASVQFSPRLYPTGTTPPDANTSGVTGLVLDAGSNALLAGATITAVFGAATQTVTADSTGRFNVTGITASQGTLRAVMSGYVSSDLSVVLVPLSQLDMGQVRLRRTQASTLLPDLTVISIDRSATVTDPRTLALSGSLAVTLGNVGTSNAPAGAQLLAFHDANNNGTYDQGDIALGRATTSSAIAVGLSTSLSIPVQGILPYRDAPILVWADSSQTVAELNENNNVRSTASACEVRPIAGEFRPVLKWRWATEKVLTIPLVAPLRDTNGDGRVDQNDETYVIFASHAGFVDSAQATLRAVSGRTGDILWSVNDSALYASASAHPAVGDIDGDGIPEIVMYLYNGGVAAINNDGSLKWLSTAPPRPGPGTYNYGAITLADLDGDGRVEILARNYVLNHDGTVRWSVPGVPHQIYAIAADLDLDGSPEVVIGGAAYRANGVPFWDNTGRQLGFTAVGNFDGDSYPELVVVSGGYVSLYDHNGAQLWRVGLPGGGGGGAPTIADMDGDGEAEIGVAGMTRYTVFKRDGSVLWSSPIQDYSMVTGSTVFDFDGDGAAEIVYGDETTFRIYNGRTGQVMFSVPNNSATATEYPVVADIDGDGHAEILVASDRGQYGLRAYEDERDTWVSARRIWNQYAYHINNINDDGTVPRVEQNSWQTHNTYRLNAFPDRSATAVADLTASLLALTDNGATQPLSLTLRVGNAGAAPSPNGVQVAFYQGDPGTGGVLLGNLVLPSLPAGAYRDLWLDPVSLAGGADIFAVVDSNNAVSECNKLNNVDRIPAVATNLLGTVAITTDASAYGPNAVVGIGVTVTNTGALGASYQLDLRIEDTNGAWVAQLPAQNVGPVAPNTAVSASGSWNTGVILAGNYQARARLLTLAGTVLSEAVSPFTITSASTPPASGPVTLRVLTDRPIYYTTDTVNISSLVANSTTNALYGAVSLRITIYNPNNLVTFTQTGSLGQLLLGSLRDLLLPVSLNGAAIATYKVSGDVLDANQAVLAHAETSYTVSFDLAKALAGKVDVSRSNLSRGDTQTCTDTIINNGTLLAAGIEVHHALVNLDTQALIHDSTASISLASNASDIQSRGFATTGHPSGNYACVLQARIGTELKTLAHASFRVTEPPIRINANLQAGSRGRLLVLLDNPNCGSQDDEHHDEDRKGLSRKTGLSTDDGCIKDADPYGPKDAPALSAQRSFLEGLLKGAGWSYTITDTADAFTRALRSGEYTAYAVLAEREKLSEQVQRELREAAFRGEGLLVAGSHDARHEKLIDSLGVKLIGNIPDAASVSFVQNPLNLSGGITLLTADLAQRIKPTSAITIARYRLGGASYVRGAHESGEPDCRDLGTRREASAKGEIKSASDDKDECEGHPGQYLDAATLNNYGKGKAAFAGFDLLASAARLGNTSQATTTLLALLNWITPESQPALTGTVLPLELVINNKGIATTAYVHVVMPAGVAVLDAGGGQVSGNVLRYITALDMGEEKILRFWVKLPSVPGPATFNVEITAGNPPAPAATTSYTATVEARELGAIKARIEGLLAARHPDGKALKAALDELDKAYQSFNPEKAIEYVLKATDALLGLTRPDVIEVRAAIGEWLRYASGILSF
jgi:hypothetical protein